MFSVDLSPGCVILESKGFCQFCHHEEWCILDSFLPGIVDCKVEQVSSVYPSHSFQVRQTASRVYDAYV